MGQKAWQILLQAAVETEANEMDCEECFELLDQYADLIIAGTPPAEIMPLVKQHLNHCDCCTHQFEALLVMLQTAAGGVTK